MSEKKKPSVLFSQLEDALEERQNGDRRKAQEPIPDNVPQDRRKGDRRAARKTH